MSLIYIMALFLMYGEPNLQAGAIGQGAQNRAANGTGNKCPCKKLLSLYTNKCGSVVDGNWAGKFYRIS